MKKIVALLSAFVLSLSLSGFSASKYPYLKDPVSRSIHLTGCPLASQDSIEYSTPTSGLLASFKPCPSCENGIETQQQDGHTVYVWAAGTEKEVRVTVSDFYYYDKGSHLSHLADCPLLPHTEEGELVSGSFRRFHTVFELLDGADTCGPCMRCQPFYIAGYVYEPERD
jgi:hypothetical protein